MSDIANKSDKRINGVSKEAWENPGTFKVVRDEQGRARSIEGWLSPRAKDDPRPSADQALQRQVVRESVNKGDNAKNGCHLIADSLGGPRIGTHGNKIAKSNIIIGDARVNTSQMGGGATSGIEGWARRDAAKHPVYMKAEVSYGKDGEPTSVRHELFKKNAREQPERYLQADTQVVRRPVETTGEATRRFGYKATDFYSPGSQGTAGTAEAKALEARAQNQAQIRLAANRQPPPRQTQSRGGRSK